MRHEEAPHGKTAMSHFTLDSSSCRVPDISRPYSSTHQHSVPLISLEHWIGSNSPVREHFGIRTDEVFGLDSVDSDFARRVSAARKCWQAVRGAKRMVISYKSYLGSTRNNK